MANRNNVILLLDESDSSDSSDGEIEIIGSRRVPLGGDDTCHIDKVVPSPFRERRRVTVEELQKRNKKKKAAREKEKVQSPSKNVAPVAKKRNVLEDPSQTSIDDHFCPSIPKKARGRKPLENPSQTTIEDHFGPVVAKKTKVYQERKMEALPMLSRHTNPCSLASSSDRLDRQTVHVPVVARKTAKGIPRNVEAEARVAALREAWRNLDSEDALSRFLSSCWMACVAFLFNDYSELKTDLEEAAASRVSQMQFASIRLRDNSTYNAFRKHKVYRGMVFVVFVNTVEKERIQNTPGSFDKAALKTMIKKHAKPSRVSEEENAVNVSDGDSDNDLRTAETSLDTDESFHEDHRLSLPDTAASAGVISVPDQPVSSSLVARPMTNSHFTPNDDPDIQSVHTVPPKETDKPDFVKEPIEPQENKGFFDFIRAWEKASKQRGFESTGELENNWDVRRANNSLRPEEGFEQAKAQYGRILFRPTWNMFENFLKLQKDDTFIDIGHGIGNAVLQAAYTCGCESRGIEICHDRHRIAERLAEDLSRDNKVVAPIRLRRGQLQLPQNRRFLTRSGKHVVKAFCNNFNGVFGEKASRNVGWTLDQYMVALFAGMLEGSKLLTLHRLPFFADPLSKTNKEREKNGLLPVKNASFYEEEIVELGPQNQTVSWSKDSGNEHQLYGYLYTRVGAPKFVCRNASCSEAQAGRLQDAVVLQGEQEEQRWVPNVCCECNSQSVMKTRKCYRPQI